MLLIQKRNRHHMILPLLLLLQTAGTATATDPAARAAPDAGAEAPPSEHRRMGIFAADINEDGKVTREELSAWLDKDFAARDKDGDGLIPLKELMQPAPGDSAATTGNNQQRPEGMAGGRRGGGGFGRMGGMGGGMGGMGGGFGHRGGGAGGSHAGGSGQWQGMHRGGGMMAGTMPGGIPRPEDSNDDGMIDSNEYAAGALAWFDDLDADRDGAITRADLPRPLLPRDEQDGSE